MNKMLNADISSLLEELIVAYKNAPGRHDQRTHAPHVGAGVLRADMDKLLDEVDMIAANWYMENVKSTAPNLTRQRQYLGIPSVVVNDESLYQVEMNDKESSKWKVEVVTKLSEKTGLSGREVSSVITAWANSSNNNDPVSLGVQQAASDEFGVELRDWQKERVSDISAVGSPNKKKFDRARDNGRKVLRAMYDETQAALKDAGIDEMRLHYTIQGRSCSGYRMD